MEQEDRLATPSKVVSLVYENDALRDGTVELERARGEFQLGHRDRARELLDSLALRLQPRLKESPEAAMIYAASRVLDARIHEAEKQTDKCREALRRAMDAYGHIPDLEKRVTRALSDYGVALEMLGRHKEAAHWLERARQMGLETQSTFHYLGLAQKALGQSDAAAATLEEAEKRDGEDGVAIVALGEVLEARSDIGAASEAYWRAAANAQLQESYEESLLLIDKCIRLRREGGPEKKAKDAGLRAAILERLQRYPEALSEIENAIKIAPPKLVDRGIDLMAAAWRIKGRILLQMERWQEAADAFAEAISRDAENTVGLVGRAKALMHLNRWAEALKLLDRALKREPGNIDFLVDKAEVLRNLQEPGKALEIARDALQRDPYSIYALEVCGGLLWQQKDFKEAASCFRRITELDSPKFDAWLDLADSFRQDCKIQEAIDTLDKAADRFESLAPADAARLQTARGKTLRDQGNRQEAAEAFRRSYADSPSLQGFIDLLDALRQLQVYERALVEIGSYLATHDTAPSEVLVHKAQLLCDLGEFAQAYEVLRPIEKDDAAVFSMRGWALEGQAFEPGAGFEFGKRALEEYRKAVRLEPSLQNKLNVANSHRLLGQAGKARKVYAEVAIELAGRSASLRPNELWTLGWCSLCLDNQAEAIRYLTAAVSTSTSGFPQFDLALAFLCDGRLGVAEREYREAIELVKQKNPKRLRAVLLVAIEDLTARSRLEPRISDETSQKILALLRGSLGKAPRLPAEPRTDEPVSAGLYLVA